MHFIFRGQLNNIFPCDIPKLGLPRFGVSTWIRWNNWKHTWAASNPIFSRLTSSLQFPTAQKVYVWSLVISRPLERYHLTHRIPFLISCWYVCIRKCCDENMWNSPLFAALRPCCTVQHQGFGMGSDQSIPNIVAQKISLRHLQHLHATPGHSKVSR